MPNAFDAAFDRGMKIGERIAERDAYGTLSQNPNDPEALKKLWRVNPEMAMKVSAYQNDRAFSDAAGEYFGNNALLGSGTRPHAVAAGDPIRNALLGPVGQPGAPAGPGASFNEAFAPFSQRGGLGNPRLPGPVTGIGGGTFDTNGRPVTTGGTGPDNPTRWADTGQPVEADFSVLGQPQNGRDKAFLRMLQADPIKALKIQSTLRDNFIERIKGEHNFYGIAVEELGRVKDDAGWQAALSRLEPYAQALGVDLGESVPLTYPGPDEVRGMLERSLPIKDKLDYMMRAANVEADNARSDRNTDSMIATREGRLAETQRYNRDRITATQRGQDMTDARVRRGQEMIDSRVRNGRKGGGGGSSRGSGATPLPVVKSPEEARKLPKGTKFRTADGRVMMVP